jgi:hypothetical protein
MIVADQNLVGRVEPDPAVERGEPDRESGEFSIARGVLMAISRFHGSSCPSGRMVLAAPIATASFWAGSKMKVNWKGMSQFWQYRHFKAKYGSAKNGHFGF